jgi:hypothetical protein
MSFWCSLAASGRHMARTLKSAVPITTSTMTARIARRAVKKTEGLSRVDPGSSLRTPVLLAATSTPDRARIMSTKETQLRARWPLGGWGWSWVMWGAPPAMRTSTTAIVGKASQTATPPVCLGPRKLIAPMAKMAVIAHFLAMADSSKPR